MCQETRDVIAVRGARVHNLQNVSVTIPRNQMTVITGVSGSGKSSLAFDTLFAEGQRRYLESLPSYARQFLDQMDKPDVDSVTGLSPAISIEQFSSKPGPRSILATTTELYDYLRLLFVALGVPRCPHCGREVMASSAEKIVERLLTQPMGTKWVILAPYKRRDASGSRVPAESYLERAAKAGFIRVRLDGVMQSLENADPTQAVETFEAVVDRLVMKAEIRRRLTDSIELALAQGEGAVWVAQTEPGGEEQLLHFSERNECPVCGIAFDVFKASSFSFNSYHGACSACEGLGVNATGARCPKCKGKRLKPEVLACRIPYPEAPGVNIADVLSHSIEQLQSWVSGLTQQITPWQQRIVGNVLKALDVRLDFLLHVGLGYLTADRLTSTLSGGELQRIRLASQIGAGLSGVMYVLDEPTIGLHPHDNAMLIAMLRRLQTLGNTLIIVEHDPAMIREADYVIDVGPGAGRLGGRITFEGTHAQMQHVKGSLTADFLAGREQPYRPKRRAPGGDWLTIRGAKCHNLKSVDASFPLGCITVVTGVSGSGKSTLVEDVLCRNVGRYFSMKVRDRAHVEFVGCKRVTGLKQIDGIVTISKNPMGRSLRSNPATYTGAFDLIRELFASTPAAKARGYAANRFSFNVKGGRCEVCKGEGQTHLAMSFLPDVVVNCEQCGGKRYNQETLEVTYAGYTIADILSMTVLEAKSVFAKIPKLLRILQTLEDVGLGYVQLGQPSSTLSGGEAQRLQLSTELQHATYGQTLYLLDEPTTGLHAADVRCLVRILARLRDAGHTLIVVEHNLDVIRAADWLIDMGPGGGEAGGTIVAAGTPEDIATSPQSLTARYL